MTALWGLLKFFDLLDEDAYEIISTTFDYGQKVTKHQMNNILGNKLLLGKAPVKVQ